MRDHRSLKAWQEAHLVAGGVLDLAALHWNPNLREVFRQLVASALSVQANITEGYALGTRGLFVRHLRIAYGSAVEAGDLLGLLKERQAIPSTTADDLLNHNHQSQRLVLGLLHRYAKP